MNNKEKKVIEEKEPANKSECFVIMPISDQEGYEKGHFERVYKDIFIPAITKAGYKPFRADDDKTTNLIHIEIIRKLLDCPMAVCDLSSRNPNVLFELGIRQAFDKPVVLVQELGTPKIFDISGLRTVDYRKDRVYHEVLEDQDAICEAIQRTTKACKEGDAINSIVRLLSITKPASLPEIKEFEKDPSLKLIMNELANLRAEISTIRRDERIRRDENRSYIENEYYLDKKKFLQLKEKVDLMMEKGIVQPEVLDELKYRVNRYRRTPYNSTELSDLVGRYETLYRIADEFVNSTSDNEKQNERNA